MTCRTVKISGTAAIVCSPRGRTKRCKCGSAATLLCDWKMPGGKRPTCDEPLCRACAYHVSKDKHLCPIHAAAYRQWLNARAAT
jgi:hypothetical protein